MTVNPIIPLPSSTRFNALNLTTSERKHDVTATPNSMPRKANPIHQQILSGLLETKPVSWVHKKLVDKSDPKSDVVKTRVTGSELRNPLARALSDANLEILAKRWMR